MLITIIFLKNDYCFKMSENFISLFSTTLFLILLVLDNEFKPTFSLLEKTLINKFFNAVKYLLINFTSQFYYPIEKNENIIIYAIFKAVTIFV